MSVIPQTALLVANGCSTRDLIDYGLDRLPKALLTIGMNFAYRYFERTDWFPDVYGFCDAKTLVNKVEDLAALVSRHPNTTFHAARRVSQLCVVRTDENADKLDACRTDRGLEKEYGFDRFRRTVTIELPKAPNLKEIKHGPTGVGLSGVAIGMGVKRILLIGADADYVERIPEAVDHPEDGHLPETYRRLIISKPIDKHPNYFFDDYQRVGDIYSTPRAATSHITGWTSVAQLAAENGVEVINCSARSRIRDFPRRGLQECLDELQ